jgi:ubiquinone/menaquinone biosynthesis C-methylase UbiE
VVTRLELAGNEKVLDIGCGTGRLLAELRSRFPHVTTVGVDADAVVLQIARRRLARFANTVELHTARAEAIPLDDAFFDVVVSTLVFHHLPLEAKKGAMCEAYRVLRRGGRMLLVDFGELKHHRVPLWLRLAERTDYLEVHVSGGLPSLMVDAGFESVRRLRRRWPAVEYWSGEKH